VQSSTSQLKLHKAQIAPHNFPTSQGTN
jgi:hypothetical protein